MTLHRNSVWLMLCLLSLHTDPLRGCSVTYCRAARDSLTCFFSEDVNKTLTSFIAEFIPAAPDSRRETLLTCSWYKNGDLSCTFDNTKELNYVISDNVTMELSSSVMGRQGEFQCQTIQSHGSPCSVPCPAAYDDHPISCTNITTTQNSTDNGTFSGEHTSSDCFPTYATVLLVLFAWVPVAALIIGICAVFWNRCRCAQNTITKETTEVPLGTESRPLFFNPLLEERHLHPTEAIEEASLETESFVQRPQQEGEPTGQTAAGREVIQASRSESDPPIEKDKVAEISSYSMRDKHGLDDAAAPSSSHGIRLRSPDHELVPMSDAQSTGDGSHSVRNFQFGWEDFPDLILNLSIPESEVEIRKCLKHVVDLQDKVFQFRRRLDNELKYRQSRASTTKV